MKITTMRIVTEKKKWNENDACKIGRNNGQSFSFLYIVYTHAQIISNILASCVQKEKNRCFLHNTPIFQFEFFQFDFDTFDIFTEEFITFLKKSKDHPGVFKPIAFIVMEPFFFWLNRCGGT